MEFDIAYERVAQLLGCKWSVRILTFVATGPKRPSEILKSEDGLAAKVMHRCLGRMEKDGLLEKTVLAEVPPHTQYHLTDQGRKFIELLDFAKEIARGWKGTQRPVRL